jgi:photosystem II stability/assembly factor-like uncharacterized protein
MPPRFRNLRLIGVVVAAAVLIAWPLAANAAGDGRRLVAEEFSRRTVYHSPQKPGWTSWVGAWLMPDGSVMACCTQATGPVGDKPRGRSYAGLDVDLIYLRSTDGGRHWHKTAESDVSFATADNSGNGTHANNGGATIALNDGSLLRRVYGWDYKAFPKMPGTAFLQRSTDYGKTWSAVPISSDGGKTWSDADPRIQEFLLDPATYTVQPTRTRRLHDGRLLMAGAVWNGPNTQSAPGEPLLMLSDDDAKTWRRVDLANDSPGKRWSEQLDEWDFAELPDGDLLVVARVPDHSNRLAGVMKKTADTWKLSSLSKSTIPHSGHPDLLATREGPVLHVATTGILWTSDAGRSWSPVVFPDVPKSMRPKEEPTSLATRYYPRSIQLPDGRILVFAHVGWDNEYSEVDQSVVMDSFRLAWK